MNTWFNLYTSQFFHEFRLRLLWYNKIRPFFGSKLYDHGDLNKKKWRYWQQIKTALHKNYNISKLLGYPLEKSMELLSSWNYAIEMIYKMKYFCMVNSLWLDLLLYGGNEMRRNRKLNYRQKELSVYIQIKFWINH